MAREIVLTHDRVALVSDEDFDWLNCWEWKAYFPSNGKPRAGRRVGVSRTVYMSRAIVGLDFGDPREADHVNFDTLDNSRENLRIITPRQNKARVPARGGSSRYIGVTWDTDRCLWRAQIQHDQRMINLGRYGTEIEAARARDAYVLNVGSGHTLNLPTG